jgi:disulfide bond formation protein DsbB
VLLITTCLVAFGPKIGGVVADYLICQLLGSGSCPADGKTGGDGGLTDPKSGPAVMAVLQTPEDCAAGGPAIDGLFPGGKWSTGDFQQFGRQFPFPEGELPAGSPADLSGQVHVDGCGTVVFTSDVDLSNPDEVHGNINWKAIGMTIAAGMIGAGAALIIAGFCSAVPALLPACPAIWSFAIGFFWNLAAAGLNNGNITGHDVLNAFVAGLIAAIPAAFGKLGPLLAKYVPIWLGKLWGGLVKVADKAWAWLKPYILNAAEKVGEFAEAAARYIRENPPWRPRPQGMEQAGLPGNLNFAGAFG